MDYKNAKIYRIVCDITGENYYGSTTQPLYKRLSEHKRQSTIQLDITSSKIIRRGNYSIVLVEECPCENKQQLHKRERYYIENNECINKNIPCRTSKEWYQCNKEYIINKSKEYNRNNKGQVAQYKKQYSIQNRDNILLYNKNNYMNKKELYNKQRALKRLYNFIWS